MFMTAGSCSVMLLWPTRRTFCCQERPAGFSAARRGGKGVNAGIDAVVVCPGVRAKAGSSEAASGSAAAPVLRNVRRLSIGFLEICGAVFLALENSCGPVDLSVDDGLDDGQRGRVGEDFDGVFCDQCGVLDLGSAEAGVIGEGLGQCDCVLPMGRDEPIALAVSAWTSLVMALDFFGRARGLVRFACNRKELGGGSVGAGGVQELRVDAGGGGEGG